MTRDVDERGAVADHDSARAARRRAIDRALQDVAVGGDPEGAFRDLYRLLFPSVLLLFLRRGFPHPDAEDLAQKTMRRVYTNMSDFRGEASFETWVLRIAGNVWKNVLRDASAQKRNAETISLDVGPDADRPSPLIDVVDSRDDAERRILRKERETIREEAIRSLPKRMQMYAFHFFVHERTQAEIAILMGISKSTVKSQLKEARARLRAILERRLGADAAAEL